ncbi:MAG: hypothetical protein KGJ13_07095 [Patescibacteria group bacterium]|nr:hypothetical protein [Patescibacteria group bacterium]
MTNHTTDAAKLLPCQQGEIPADRWNELSAAIVEAAKTWKGTSEDRAAMMLFSHRDSVIRFIWPIIQRWNTRPQPAPPDYDDEITADNIVALNKIVPDEEFADFKPAPPPGEPDFVVMAGEISNLLGEARAIPHVKIIEAALRDAYDLGLAARPKVEDAEVATEIALIDGFLNGTHGTDKKSFRLYMKRWRDLLERLAMKVEALEVRDTQWGLACQVAEAKLAEREAELAKADAVIYSLWEKDATISPDERSELDKARARHAARQQQKESK